MKPQDEELEGISGYIDDFVQAIGEAGLKLPYAHDELFKEPEVNDGDSVVSPDDVSAHEL